MKKILLSILTTILVFSCSSITAQEHFSRGNYLAALETTAKELVKNKKELTIDEENEIVYRIRTIEKIYQDKIEKSYDDKSKALSYFELWQMIDIVEKNPVLLKYLSISRYNGYEVLSNSARYISRYVNEDPLNRVEILREYIEILKDRRAVNSSYRIIYQDLAKISADIYIKRASYYNNLNRLEEARDNYYLAYKVYSEFDSNYQNSYNLYRDLERKIEISKADKSFEEGVKRYNEGEYERAAYEFETAKNIYTRYKNESKLNQISVYEEAIHNKISLKLFNKYYQLATEQTLSGARARDKQTRNHYYTKAIEYYKLALKYSKNYESINEINRRILDLEYQIKNN